MFSILWIPSLPFTSVVSAVPGHPLCNQGLLFFFLFFSFFSISDLSTSILLFYLSFHHPFILRFCSLMGIGVDYVVWSQSWHAHAVLGVYWDAMI